MTRDYDYPSVICKYCCATNYGMHSCDSLTPNGYSSCEGSYCGEAYENYVDETGDYTPLEELF